MPSWVKGDQSAFNIDDRNVARTREAKVELKTAINANADLKAKLDTATCPIETIVAVTTEALGPIQCT